MKRMVVFVLGFLVLAGCSDSQLVGLEKTEDVAVNSGVSKTARATETVKDVTAAWVKDQNVLVQDGRVVEYRVTLKVTFVLKD